jgi:Fic-DOC domain mobile mystery protein B
MGLELDYTDGQTPLDEDEKEGLLISTISVRAELDEFEQLNIEQAIQWIIQKKFRQEVVLSEAFIKQVHKKMYGHVWAWAGTFRKTNKNLGVDKWQIGIELKNLLDDTSHWISRDIYSPEEIATRFKHRIVSIHCFANGNGRHSRLMADIIIEKIFQLPVFNWGATNLIKQGDSRKIYLKSVRCADAGDYGPLLVFARE